MEALGPPPKGSILKKQLYTLSKEEGKDLKTHIDDFNKNAGTPKNNLVVFNFKVSDLAQEYEWLKKANIGEISELMYVNVHMPYWYFNIIDPDGNTLEITGEYE